MLNYRILDLLNKSSEYGYITYTHFLTPDIYNELSHSYLDVNIYSMGKIRKIFAFVPNYIDDFDFPISLIKIEIKNQFKDYTHRDFLGAIMNLNIKREMIGDIFTQNNIAYVYISNDIKDFILTNLKEIGKNKCNISVLEEYIDLDFKYEEKIYTISSYRLDCIIAAICNFSREDAKKYIESSKIKINYEIFLDKSKELKTNDILSINKYGRYIVGDIVSNTKKNKIKILIKKFI